MAADGSNINSPAVALLNLKLPNGQFAIPTPQTINPAQSFALRGFSAFSIPARFLENQGLANFGLRPGFQEQICRPVLPCE